MRTRQTILSFVAVVLLSAITFLFMHSEMDMFHSHHEDCKNTDLCLIVDAARPDNIHTLVKFQKIIQQSTLIIDHIVSPKADYKTQSIYNSVQPFYPELIEAYIKNCTMLN